MSERARLGAGQTFQWTKAAPTVVHVFALERSCHELAARRARRKPARRSAFASSDSSVVYELRL